MISSYASAAGNECLLILSLEGGTDWEEQGGKKRKGTKCALEGHDNISLWPACLIN